MPNPNLFRSPNPLFKGKKDIYLIFKEDGKMYLELAFGSGITRL